MTCDREVVKDNEDLENVQEKSATSAAIHSWFNVWGYNVAVRVRVLPVSRYRDTSSSGVYGTSISSRTGLLMLKVLIHLFRFSQSVKKLTPYSVNTKTLDGRPDLFQAFSDAAVIYILNGYISFDIPTSHICSISLTSSISFIYLQNPPHLQYRPHKPRPPYPPQSQYLPHTNSMIREPRSVSMFFNV